MQWHTLQQDWFQSQARRRNEGGEGGEKKSGAGCAPRNQGEKKRGEERGERGEGSKVEKQGASHLCPHVLQPCHHAMLLREECIHAHANAWQYHPRHLSHHHHDELFVCQCVLQPAIPLCVCVCLCVQRARQCRQQAGEHTPPKKKRGERVCARGGKGKQPAK